MRRYNEGEDIAPVIERMAESYARRSSCDKDDLIQEAWLDLLRRPLSPKILVTRTAITNAVVKEICWRNRQKKFAKPISIDEWDAIDAKIDAQAMLSLMDDNTRDVCQKHYIDGMSLPEIARSDSIPFKTIESRLYKGMLKFKNRLCGGVTSE